MGTDLEKIQVRISKDEADKRQAAQHDTKNWEIHLYPETSANNAKTKSLNTNTYGRKGHERKRLYKCLCQRKKEQTTNACGKERKPQN